MHPHVDVEASVQLRLVVADADAVPLPVSLRYCATDPYAVRAVFSGDGMEVEWVFARDLLRTGLTSPVGEGDVHVWPSWGTGRELLMISLTSPDGQAVLEAGAQDVRFVPLAGRRVPAYAAAAGKALLAGLSNDEVARRYAAAAGTSGRNRWTAGGRRVRCRAGRIDGISGPANGVRPVSRW